ncbi:MAG: glycosyltransferase involved in cell wall biosynthesis [Acidimicrobiales bacterium]
MTLIGVVKPDYGIAGGFERLLERLVAQLVDAGHRVEEVSFPAIILPRPVWGHRAGYHQWRKHIGFFNYLALAEEVRRLDLSRYDLVISTQPPTFLADHPNVLALFYHHARIFYDLAELFARTGDVDPVHHARATEIVRQVDQKYNGGVRHWLAGSNECASRLTEFWGVDRSDISLLHAPALTAPPTNIPAWQPGGPVVTVSRHEWPKRTELVVAAAHLLGGKGVEVIGGGGRLDHVRALDHRLVHQPGSVSSLDPEELWMGSAVGSVAPPAPAPGSPVVLHGWTDDQTRDERYRAASVVVAPAHREDYGLTALEAMLWERPVVVCDDGGGLVDLINDTGGGLVVPPTPAGIADGVNRIINDPALAASLIDAAKQVSATYTWDRCKGELLAAVEKAL